ncbi:hypothetical protein Tco_0540868, partial [Tanacetum coccineum]
VVDNKPVDIVDIEKLGKDLENASLLEIMDRALEKYGNVIAMAFRFSSLNSGRLNPETYKFLNTVERHYGIRIEYMLL